MYNENEFEALSSMNLNKLADDAKKELGEQYNDIYGDLLEESERETVIVDNKVNDTEQQILSEEYDTKDIPKISSYEEELFPNGPKTSEVSIWKKKYEGYGLFLIEVSEKPFVIRTMNRLEYKQIIAIPNIDALLREELICSKCIVWPKIDFENLASLDAGVPSTVSEIIMEKSGFTKEYAVQVI